MKTTRFCLFFVVVFFLSLFRNYQFLAADSWDTIYGDVTFNGDPVCAMVLANGQYMFTCSGDGSFNLDVPLDSQEQITVYAFCSGMAPYKQIIGAGQGAGIQISMASDEQDQSMDVSCTLQAVNGNWVRMNGHVMYNNMPVCAMVLANGQYMFTCSGDGSFSLDVPLDDMGSITLFGFCEGLSPYKTVYTSENINFNNDTDGDGYTIADGDCDDLSAAVNPGSSELCSDGIDQDCDGSDLQCGGGGSSEEYHGYDATTEFDPGTPILSMSPQDRRLAWMNDEDGFSYDFYGTRDENGYAIGIDQIDMSDGIATLSFYYNADGKLIRMESIDSDLGVSAALVFTYLSDTEVLIDGYSSVTTDPNNPDDSAIITLPEPIPVALSVYPSNDGTMLEIQREIAQRAVRQTMLQAEVAAAIANYEPDATANPIKEVKATFRVEVKTESGDAVTDAIVAFDITGPDRAPNVSAAHTGNGIYQAEVTLVKTAKVSELIDECNYMKSWVKLLEVH